MIRAKKNIFYVLAVATVLFLSVPMTSLAFFGDRETSTGNSLSASSLGIELSITKDSGDFRELSVLSDGAVDAEYMLSFTVSGEPFCNDISVRIQRNGVDLSNTIVANYDSPTYTLPANSSDEWRFNFDLENNASAGGTCVIVTTYKANQNGYAHGVAFFDTETYAYTLTLADFGVTPTVTPSSNGIFINEVLANPTGDEPANERIELYNNTGGDIDLTDWYVTDSINQMVATLSGIITNGAFVEFAATYLNNDTDTLTLYDNTDTVRDTFVYTQATNTNEGKTASRCPDGGDVEESTNPTIGTPNDCASLFSTTASAEPSTFITTDSATHPEDEMTEPPEPTP